MTYFWIILCVILVIIEFLTLQFVSIWFAGGALIAFISSFFLPFKSQIIVFAVYSIILLICTIPFVKKMKTQKHIPTNIDMNIGKDVIIIERVDKKKNTGRANLNGVNWIAVSEDGKIIEKGETAIIKEIKGATLIVGKEKIWQ